jgi:hypothetical protein
MTGQDGTGQETQSPHLTAIGHRPVQGVGKPVHTEHRVGRLSNQARPASRSNVTKNLLEYHPPRRQEHHRKNEKAMEAPTDLDKHISYAWGLTGHLIYP